jgi:hypothetical protein
MLGHCLGKNVPLIPAWWPAAGSDGWVTGPFVGSSHPPCLPIGDDVFHARDAAVAKARVTRLAEDRCNGARITVAGAGKECCERLN